MSDIQQPQDHPGPEWVESPAYVLDGSIMGGFHHPGLNRGVDYIGSSHGEASIRREEAIARCRAISAAALEWEFRRGVAFGQGLANASNFQHLIRGLAQ